MSNWLKTYEENRDKLIQANAYDPAHEHSSCGVGLVASIDGTPRRDVVEMSIPVSYTHLTLPTKA